MKNEADIIERCRKNDREAQAMLYRSLAPLLLGVAMRYIRQRDEAEDIMQESFVKIFTNLDSFRNEGSFEGWARKITANEALRILRKKKLVRVEKDLEIVESIEFSKEETQEFSVNELMDCMSSLPAGYNAIINLFLVEEFSHREIAEKLNISESTSRSQYSRARQALYKIMKQRSGIQLPKNA